MDENDICDQHGRSLDHPWGCFGCSLAESLSKNETTWEPQWPPRKSWGHWPDLFGKGHIWCDVCGGPCRDERTAADGW